MEGAQAILDSSQVPVFLITLFTMIMKRKMMMKTKMIKMMMKMEGLQAILNSSQVLVIMMTTIIMLVKQCMAHRIATQVSRYNKALFEQMVKLCSKLCWWSSGKVK